MYILSRKQGQIIDIIYCGKVIAQILVKNIGHSNVELGFTGQKEQILFMRGEKVIPNNSRILRVEPLSLETSLYK